MKHSPEELEKTLLTCDGVGKQAKAACLDQVRTELQEALENNQLSQEAVTHWVNRTKSLEADRDRLKQAIQDCIATANNRQSEWGQRAESAFEYLYAAMNNTTP